MAGPTIWCCCVRKRRAKGRYVVDKVDICRMCAWRDCGDSRCYFNHDSQPVVVGFSIRTVAEVEFGSQLGVGKVSDVSKLGVGLAETIRDRVRDPEPAGNPKAVAATEESMEARKFRAEVRELRSADEILKAAAGFFVVELDRPQRNL